MHVDPVDARTGRSAPDLVLEPIHGRLVALGPDLDPTVRQVGHPPADAFAPGGLLHEETESHALYAPAYEESPRHEHPESI